MLQYFNFSIESKSHVNGGKKALLHSYMLLLRLQKNIVFSNVDMLENFTKILNFSIVQMENIVKFKRGGRYKCDRV